MRPELKSIERNKEGFVTDKCLEQMQQALPIIIRVEHPNWFYCNEYVDEDNWSAFIDEIKTDIYYKSYFKCPQID